MDDGELVRIWFGGPFLLILLYIWIRLIYLYSIHSIERTPGKAYFFSSELCKVIFVPQSQTLNKTPGRPTPFKFLVRSSKKSGETPGTSAQKPLRFCTGVTPGVSTYRRLPTFGMGTTPDQSLQRAGRQNSEVGSAKPAHRTRAALKAGRKGMFFSFLSFSFFLSFYVFFFSESICLFNFSSWCEGWWGLFMNYEEWLILFC